MTITVNGAPHEIADGVTVSALLTHLGLPADGVAVAVDGTVVPRSRHGATALSPGARVEVVRAVGGG